MPEHALKAAAARSNIKRDNDDSSDEENEERNAKRKRTIDDNMDAFSKLSSPKNVAPKVDNSKSRLIMEHAFGSRISVVFLIRL